MSSEEFINTWIKTPAIAMNLSSDQQNFIRDQNIFISVGYIGMVRLYKDNRTIWQTSALKPISDIITRSFEPKGFSEGIVTDSDYQDLSIQCRNFLDELMTMSDEERQVVFNRNLSLI
jgi:hypothetical protein